MDNKFIIEKYRVVNIIIDFDKMNDGENEISLISEVRIKTPQKDDISSALVEIVVTFKNVRNNEIVFKIINQGFVAVNNISSEEELQALLKDKAVPIIYDKTREQIGDLIKLANIDFMNIPKFSELN